LFCFWYSLSLLSGVAGIDIIVPNTSFIPLYPLSQIASLIGVALVLFAEVKATSRVFESCSFLLCDATPTITPESFVATIDAFVPYSYFFTPSVCLVTFTHKFSFSSLYLL